MHQADLLYLPHDKVYQNTYKYTLQVIDVASRYKVSRPLRTKKSQRSRRDVQRHLQKRDLCDIRKSYTWTTVQSSKQTS